MRAEEECHRLRWPDVPNRECLHPPVSHPAHDLLNGSLLEPTGVEQMTDGYLVTVCDVLSCTTHATALSGDLHTAATCSQLETAGCVRFRPNLHVFILAH
jgi:hypothetical protein